MTVDTTAQRLPTCITSNKIKPMVGTVNPFPFVALDFETADYGQDSACALGLVRVEAGRIVQREHRLIRPPRRRFVFTHIHGLTWGDVAAVPSFAKTKLIDVLRWTPDAKCSG
jgi:DNA polymerase III epsilon subunit-like protein